MTVSVQERKALLTTAGLTCSLWCIYYVVSHSERHRLSRLSVHVCMCVPISLWTGFAYSCLSLCSICRCRLSALLAKSNLKRLVPSSAEVRCLSASCNLHHYNQGQTQGHGEKKLGGRSMEGEGQKIIEEDRRRMTGKGLRFRGGNMKEGWLRIDELGWGEGWCFLCYNTRE